MIILTTETSYTDLIHGSECDTGLSTLAEPDFGMAALEVGVLDIQAKM